MARQLKMTIGDEVFYASVTEDGSPRLAALESAGAFESWVLAANVNEGELFFPTPVRDLPDAADIRVDMAQPGDVTFFDDWNTLCLFTSETDPTTTGRLVARIAQEDLPRLRKLYRRVWRGGRVRVTVRLVDVDLQTGAEKALGPEHPAAAPMQPAVARLESLLEEIWLERPYELDDMVAAQADTGRELGVWAYAWGQLMSLSDMLLVLMGMAQEKDGSVRTLRAVAAEQCRSFSVSLGTQAHMVDTQLILAEIASYFGTVETYESYLGLARAAQRWVLQMAFWCNLELPWGRLSKALHKAWNPGEALVEPSAAEDGHKKKSEKKKAKGKDGHKKHAGKKGGGRS